MIFLIKALQLIFTIALVGSGTLNVEGQGFSPEIKTSSSDPNLANCYADDPSRRVLPFRVKNLHGETSGETIQTCSYWAAVQGYKYFGLEFGGECWAGDNNVQLNTVDSSGNCNMACRSRFGNDDDTTLNCGGLNAINVFTTEFPKYEYVGCYQDSGNRDFAERLVGYAAEKPGPSNHYILNAPACAYRAQRAGYKYFALQNGGECWGSNTYGRMGAAQDCYASNCPPEAPKFKDTDKCGGGYVNAVYKLTDAEKKDSASSFVGCYKDDATTRNTRDFSTQLNTYNLDGSESGYGPMMDYQSCSFLAKKYGYTFFGLQYGSECWGGNTVGRYGLAPSIECDSPCDPKSPGENCGGANRNYVYATKPPPKTCATNEYYDVKDKNCKGCLDIQWSDGGAIWSCYPCFGGGGSRAAKNCQRIVPTATATATISGVTVTVTDQVPVPDDNNNNNNNNNAASVSNKKIGIIVGTSVAAFVVLLMGASILYILYRRRQHNNNNNDKQSGQVQPQPVETSSGAVHV